MGYITMNFNKIPYRAVKSFVSIVNGVIALRGKGFYQVVREKVNWSEKLYMRIDFYLDRKSEHYVMINATPIFDDSEVGIRIFEKSFHIKLEIPYGRGYIALLREPITTQQMYKAYEVCLKHYEDSLAD